MSKVMKQPIRLMSSEEIQLIGGGCDCFTDPLLVYIPEHCYWDVVMELNISKGWVITGD